MLRRLDRRSAARPEFEFEPRREAATVCLVLGDGPAGERISGVKLLIGGADDCDVRLEGDAPDLHSIVHSDRDGVWLDAVVPDPPVCVNGEPTEWSRLHDGDVLEIGLLEMTVRICAPHSTAIGGTLEPAPRARVAAARSAHERRTIAVRAMLNAALERGLTSDDRFDEPCDPSDDAGRVVPLDRALDRRRADVGRAIRLAVTPDARERVDRAVMALEELAARLEALAGDLDARQAFGAPFSERRLATLEESLLEIGRLIDVESRVGSPSTPTTSVRHAA